MALNIFKKSAARATTDNEIVIVGGGPVGLWAATQIKKRDPACKVTVYERYQEYKRSHVLRLEGFSLLLYAKMIEDKNERNFFNTVLGHSFDNPLEVLSSKKPVFIRTNDLEAALKSYAAQCGIDIRYESITAPEDVMQKHPRARAFVAADGAHSKMRAAIMGPDAVDDYPLQYVVEMKYQAEGKAGSLGLVDGYKTNKLMTHMAFEYIGREKDGVTPATARFFVDEATYQAMPEATFKEPIKLGDARIPESLAKDIETLMSVRAAEAGEKYIEGSAKLSKLTLSHYVAKKFATTYNDRPWFLVGDAALGVPYFRSLNAGLIIASQLAAITTAKALIGNTAKIAAYNLCRPLDLLWEVTSARGKDAGLHIYDTFRKLNAKVPWQMVKWKNKK